MLEALQKFFPWASTLPPVAKLLLSAIIAGLAILALVLIWAPVRRNAVAEETLWPANATLNGLTERIDRLSKTDRRLLKLAVDAGRDGIYVFQLVDSLQISRAETLLRAERLESYDLLQSLDLTDKNFRQSRRLRDFVSSTRPEVLEALLR